MNYKDVTPNELEKAFGDKIKEKIPKSGILKQHTIQPQESSKYHKKSKLKLNLDAVLGGYP